MKKLYSVKRVVHLSTALLFLLILTVIYSCRKELKLMPLSATDSVDAARSWYEASYPVNNALSVNNNLTTLGVNSNGLTPFDFSQNIKPDWNHNARYKRFGKDVIEMPVDPGKVLYYGLKNKNTGQYISAKENSRAWFLLLNNGKQYTAYIMVLIGAPSYINGDPSKLAKNSYRKRDANFSGMLLYFTPKGKFIRSYKYVNGSMVTYNNQAAITTSQQTQSVKKTNKLSTICIDWYDTVWDGNGDVVWEQYIGTTCADYDDGSGGGGGNGGGGDPPPPPPSCQVTNSVTKQMVNQLPPDTDPDDPQPIDPGYPDPGDGGCTGQTSSDTSRRVSGLPSALTQAFPGSCVFMNMQIVGSLLGVNVTEDNLISSYAAATNQLPADVQQNGIPTDANYSSINNFIGQYFNAASISLSEVVNSINDQNPVMGFVITGTDTQTNLFDGHEVTVYGYIISNGVTTYQYVDTTNGTIHTTSGNNIGNLHTIKKK